MADEILAVTALEAWFTERLQGLSVWHSSEVVAYVVGVFASKKLAKGDLSDVSVVLEYEAAKLKRDFAAFQRLGDWVLWVKAMHPIFLGPNHDVVENLGRMSYYTCNDIMHGQWRVYAELGNDLPLIAQHIQRLV